MREALVALLADVAHHIDIIDIDGDPGLLVLYDELVPVLFARRSETAAQPGRQLCHYFLDVNEVRAFCEQ